MAATDFLKANLKGCKVIIDSLLLLKPTFTSHEFIEKFRAKYPKEYISWLGAAPESKDAQFQTVNSLIASFLGEYDSVLGIEKRSRENRLNDHGNKSGVQVWQAK